MLAGGTSPEDVLQGLLSQASGSLKDFTAQNSPEYKRKLEVLQRLDNLKIQGEALGNEALQQNAEKARLAMMGQKAKAFAGADGKPFTGPPQPDEAAAAGEAAQFETPQVSGSDLGPLPGEENIASAVASSAVNRERERRTAEKLGTSLKSAQVQNTQRLGASGDVKITPELAPLTGLPVGIDIPKDVFDKIMAQKGVETKAGAVTGAAKIRADASAAKGPGLVAITTADENGNPQTEFVPKVAGKVYAKPITGPVRDKQTQAMASLEIGNDLLSHIQSDEGRSVLGPVLGRFKNLEAAAGAGDPVAQRIRGELKGFAAMQLRIHGSRAYEMVRDIDKLLATAQDPDALAGGLNGILAASRVLAKTPGTYGKEPQNTPPTGGPPAPVTPTPGKPTARRIKFDAQGNPIG